jgi:hypothetical protein
LLPFAFRSFFNACGIRNVIVDLHPRIEGTNSAGATIVALIRLIEMVWIFRLFS